jgi:hypothetical protein
MLADSIGFIAATQMAQRGPGLFVSPPVEPLV